MGTVHVCLWHALLCLLEMLFTKDCHCVCYCSERLKEEARLEEERERKEEIER